MVVVGPNPLRDAPMSMASAQGDSLRQVCYTALFLLAVVGSQPHRRPGRLLPLPFSVTLMLLWSLASLHWALDPAIGARRLLLTTMLLWTAFRLVNELGHRNTLEILRVFLAVAVVCNFAAIAFSPMAIHRFAEVGDPNLAGSWRGFTGQKNWAGALCAVTILLFVFGADRWRPVVRLLVVVAAAYFLYRTMSKTSIGMLMVAIAAGSAFRVYNPAYRALLVPAAMISGSALVYYGSTYGDSWVEVFSDPKAFTGRTQIWPALLAFSDDHPMGAGFGSFWNIGPSGPIFSYASGWVTELGNGHNGYLDLLATIGVPGLVLTLVALIVVPLVRLLASRRVSRGDGALLVSLLVFCAAHNLTESSIMDRDMIMQMVLVLTVAMIAKATFRRSWSGIARMRRHGGRLAVQTSLPIAHGQGRVGA